MTGLNRRSAHVIPSEARNLLINHGDPSSQAPQDDVSGRNGGQCQITYILTSWKDQLKSKHAKKESSELGTNPVYEEIKALIKHWSIWFMLGNQDIKLKYRRSTIGPFWITISMAVTVFSMGFLYGHLFKLNLDDYFPYLASGVIGWSFISTLILEGSTVFIDSETYIRNQDSFMCVFMMRLLLKNSVIFMHNMLVFIPIMFIFHLPISFKILLIIPGLLFIGINALCWGTLVGIIGTRYRDFQPIITSLIQVIFFLTPIMWMPNLLPSNYQWIIAYNPFNQFLNLIRVPLMNNVIDLHNLLVVLFVSMLGFLLYAYFIKKYKHRIVFWL